MPVADVVREALRNMFVADSIAMPVHWYYNVGDILRAFPPHGVEKLEPPPSHHPSSIMSLHSTSAGGRKTAQAGGAAREIVGDVILRGKRHLWGVKNQHYHAGMRAGENTLNAHCARVAMRSVARSGGKYDRDDFLTGYIELLTADPPRHPDTYAESYHRGFFANLEAGKPPHACAADTHDTASVGCLVGVPAVALAPLVSAVSASTCDTASPELKASIVESAVSVAREHVRLTHPGEQAEGTAESLVRLMAGLVGNAAAGGGVQGARRVIKETARSSAGGLDLEQLVGNAASDAEVVGGKFSTACYLDSSWPSLLFLSYKYADDPKKAILVNANLGGDNVHRGAIIGVITGLSSGRGVPEFFSELADAKAIDAEIDALLG